MNTKETIDAILAETGKAVLGKDDVLSRILTAILAGGHILIDHIPGVGKTTMAVAFTRTLGLDHKHVVVTLPRGERYEAEIYHGTAGYGEYYQLRFTSGSPSLPGYRKLNDRLIVLLEKAAGRSHATLEYRA